MTITTFTNILLSRWDLSILQLSTPTFPKGVGGNFHTIFCPYDIHSPQTGFPFWKRSRSSWVCRFFRVSNFSSKFLQFVLSSAFSISRVCKLLKRSAKASENSLSMFGNSFMLPMVLSEASVNLNATSAFADSVRPEFKRRLGGRLLSPHRSRRGRIVVLLISVCSLPSTTSCFYSIWQKEREKLKKMRCGTLRKHLKNLYKNLDPQLTHSDWWPSAALT